MSSTWGNKVKISIFGESHGPALGVVVDGLPAGELVDMDALLLQMARRAPGRDKSATPRAEADAPKFLSGLLDGVTTGAPVCIVIENTNTKSGDYADFKAVPRPGHADYAASLRYRGHNDIRGGGHFSGRLTAALCAAGGVCRQVLERRGVRIGAHLYAVGNVNDTPFDVLNVEPALLERLSSNPFPVIAPAAETAMRAEIEAARMSLDSVGGVVECAVTGYPAGLGDPMFGGVEPLLASILFGIPAVKGVEFGGGFALSAMRGSRANDPYRMEEGVAGSIKTTTNNAGGALGGITYGMPIVFRCAFKPTPTISQPQQTVNLRTAANTTLEAHGRHDPCVAPRAVPVVEACAAIALLDLMRL